LIDGTVNSNLVSASHDVSRTPMALVSESRTRLRWGRDLAVSTLCPLFEEAFFGEAFFGHIRPLRLASSCLFNRLLHLVVPTFVPPHSQFVCIAAASLALGVLLCDKKLCLCTSFAD